MQAINSMIFVGILLNEDLGRMGQGIGVKSGYRLQDEISSRRLLLFIHGQDLYPDSNPGPETMQTFLHNRHAIDSQRHVIILF